MEIRRAESSDVERLLEIYNYEVEHGVATLDLTPKTLDEWQQWFAAHQQPHHPLYVAVCDGVTAGYASLSTYREKEAYCSTVELSIYIAPEWRGRGVATALMGHLLELARRDPGIHNVVSVITAGNAASVRLHEKFSFVYCGTIPQVGEKFGRRLDIENYSLLV